MQITQACPSPHASRRNRRPLATDTRQQQQIAAGVCPSPVVSRNPPMKVVARAAGDGGGCTTPSPPYDITSSSLMLEPRPKHDWLTNCFVPLVFCTRHTASIAAGLFAAILDGSPRRRHVWRGRGAGGVLGPAPPSPSCLHPTIYLANPNSWGN